MNKQLLVLAILLSMLAPSLVAAEIPKCTARDWTQTSQVAQESNIPILILYTSEGCGYCEKLKNEVLEPMLRKSQDQRNMVLREVDINTGGKMIDFNGDMIRSRQFKNRYKVFATPTLLIVDANGEALRDNIIGYNTKAQYEHMLQSVFDASRDGLHNAGLRPHKMVSHH